MHEPLYSQVISVSACTIAVGRPFDVNYTIFRPTCCLFFGMMFPPPASLIYLLIFKTNSTLLSTDAEFSSKEKIKQESGVY
jgi:hypothetical protein